MELRPEEITKIIRSQIKNYAHKMEASETGVVILVGDGIAKASGLDKCVSGELVEFPDGSFGMAQNLEEDTVSITILGSDQGIKEGDTISVKLLEVDEKTGKFRLSHRVLEEKPEGWEDRPARRPRREGGEGRPARRERRD